jgi:hypothetical protein
MKQHTEENKIMTTSIRLPDWDWGTPANEKLAKLFETQDQKDFFCEYLINEMPVDNLVMYMLRYTPRYMLRELADAIGTYKLEGLEDEH